MSTDTGLELGPKSLASSVSDFVVEKDDYYNDAFAKIQGKTGFAWSWNGAAALAGPLWGAFRGLWGFFWTFLVLELFALVQIGRGLWGDLGADQMARFEKLADNIAKRKQQAEDLVAAGDQAAADAALKVAGNLQKAADKAEAAAASASAEALTILLTGLALLLVIKIIEGFYGNVAFAYEKQYLRWRARPDTPSGVSQTNVIFGGFLLLGIWPLTIYRFTVAKPLELITEFPMKKEWFTPVANWMEGGFDWLATEFGGVFKGVTAAIRTVLDGLEIILVDTPWPVVMLVIVVMAWRLAGPRIAVFTAAALAYLATFGLWEVSMVTVALLGSSA